MVIPDILYRLRQGGAEVVFDQCVGAIELFFADPKLVLAQLGAVVLAGEPDQSRVAVCANSGQYLPHSSLNVLQIVLCALVEQLAALFWRQLRQDIVIDLHLLGHVLPPFRSSSRQRCFYTRRE